MGSTNPEFSNQTTSQKILGYLNFSSGAVDASFIKFVDATFKFLENSDSHDADVCTANRFYEWLKCEIERLTLATDSPIKDFSQAASVLELAFESVLPSYLKHHNALLFHQKRDFLFNSFFVARVLQSVLQAGGPWDEKDRIASFALNELNSFLGHRPVATLESQQIQPYGHEWIGPIPIYLAEIGVAHGSYNELIESAIEILGNTNPTILREAHFALDRLTEIGIDPRAFDFDHPINKRPNHHFGQWDAHSVSNSGYFRRFIIHQVTLDALLGRVERKSGDDEELNRQFKFEASAVLACTMLMASGISGSAPDSFDSNTTLATLLPIIAGYRDQFYQELIEKLSPEHKDRLLHEAEARRQPFGAARQDLNRLLGKRRASQLVNCRLASIFARMGFSEAADQQSQIVPVASARILCQIDCLLSSAKQAAKRKELKKAYEIIPRVMSLLKLGVDCGAIVDPWNIIGFDANYSLFPATENSVPDHRVYELVDLVERILGMCSLIWSEAAAVDDQDICHAIKNEFSNIVDWWRKYAAHEVMSVDAVDPEEIFSAADFVAQALNLWHKGGAAAGDIEFWKQHAELFDSPKAYHLVIEALMDRRDYQTSSALLVHWLSQSEFVRLQHGDSSFHNLVWRWITEQRDRLKISDFEQRNEIWNRIRKFYDFIEANAEHYGQVPKFRIGRSIPKDQDELLEPEDEALDLEEDDLFEAAYEGIVYHDSTDDGVEGSIFDSSQQSDDELEAEVDRVMDRLEFLGTISNFWRIAATFPLPVDNRDQLNESATKQLNNRRNILASWISHANQIRADLTGLLHTVLDYKIPQTGVDHESLVQYDRYRLYKESLLDRIVETCVEAEHATSMLAAVIAAIDYLIEKKPVTELGEGVNGNAPLVSLFAAVLLMDLRMVEQQFPDAIEYLHTQPLLYVPLNKGGSPAEIISARVLQEEIRDLAGSLPILGMFVETYELVSTALAMERNHNYAGSAVTEFDNLFEVAYTALVKCLVQSTQLFHAKLAGNPEMDDQEAAVETESVLFECIELVTESLSILWLNHSKTLRLSVLEKVSDNASWDKLVEFIQRYGSGLFTQQLLQLNNARAILHQGTETWLQNVRNASDAVDLRLFDELDKAISMRQAGGYLTLILEAICENYNEYRDYNTTTTQSDRGELLYMFFDFIRLRNRFDRVCWYLKPIVWGHEILVRDGQNSVARMWRRSLREQIGSEADKYLELLEQLRDKYSMQMASVGRRLEGRFVHEMQIDRLRSLVKPAMGKPGSKTSNRAFEKLQQETQKFIQATPGVGVDLPAWLAALEHEVQQFHLPLRLRTTSKEQTLIRPLDIPVAQLQEQLELLPRKDEA